MQFSGNMIGITGRWERIAPAEAGSIIRADARSLREGRLHPAPDEPVVAQPSVENNSRRAASAAVDAHRVPLHQKCLPGRRVAKAIEADPVEGTTADYRHCGHS